MPFNRVLSIRAYMETKWKLFYYFFYFKIQSFQAFKTPSSLRITAAHQPMNFSNIVLHHVLCQTKMIL